MEARIKIVTYKDGHKVYYPQVRKHFLFFHWWADCYIYHWEGKITLTASFYTEKEARDFLARQEKELIEHVEYKNYN